MNCSNPLKGAWGDPLTAEKRVLDINNVDDVDSVVVRWLLSCAKQMYQQGGLSVLAQMQHSIQQVLELIRLDGIRDWHETIELTCQKIQTPKRCAV